MADNEHTLCSVSNIFLEKNALNPASTGEYNNIGNIQQQIPDTWYQVPGIYYL